MLDPQTVYLISIGQYMPTRKETIEMACVLHNQECAKQAMIVNEIVIESNVKIGRA